MSQVFAIILLMIFFVPALFSILFASRSPLMILWNLSWYYVLGFLGQMATRSPSGRYLGWIFFGLYLLRLMSTRKGPQIQTRFFRGGKIFQSSHHPSSSSYESSPYNDTSSEQDSSTFHRPSKKQNSDVVIDAEFSRK
jgi:hypothetical protein